MPEIKLIALDLDDTLLRNDLTISERAKKAILDAAGLGVSVTLATGRMFSSARPYAVELGLDLPLITYQGALVQYVDGRMVYHRPIETDQARDLVRFIQPYGYQLNVYINDELYVHKDSPEGKKYAETFRVPVHLVDDLAGALTAPPSKLLIIGNEDQLDHLEIDLRQAFGDSVCVTKTSPKYLEVTHPRATKGQALARLAQSLGLDRGQVMAMGDSRNDIDMVAYAGFGVAMENAQPEVKKVAYYVTKRNDDDGVAEAIEKLVLGR